MEKKKKKLHPSPLTRPTRARMFSPCFVGTLPPDRCFTCSVFIAACSGLKSSLVHYQARLFPRKMRRVGDDVVGLFDPQLPVLGVVERDSHALLLPPNPCRLYLRTPVGPRNVQRYVVEQRGTKKIYMSTTSSAQQSGAGSRSTSRRPSDDSYVSEKSRIPVELTKDQLFGDTVTHSLAT